MADTTSFDIIIEKFLHKIEKDRDFFSYYNVSIEKAKALALEQSLNYLLEAVDLLYDNCTPEVDFYDYDAEVHRFNFELTQKEIGLLADLMRQIYFERDLSLLKAFKIAMTPSDLNQFSPASERKTFMNMLKNIENDNMVKISRYASVDRKTGKRKTLDYSSYLIDE